MNNEVTTNTNAKTNTNTEVKGKPGWVWPVFLLLNLIGSVALAMAVTGNIAGMLQAERQQIATDYNAMVAAENADLARIVQHKAMLAKECAASPSCVAEANAYQARVTEQAAAWDKLDAYLDSVKQHQPKSAVPTPVQPSPVNGA